MPRKRYSVVLDPELVVRVKGGLGDTSFSRFTERALEAALGNGKRAVDPVAPGIPSAASPPASPRAPGLLERTEPSKAERLEKARAMLPAQHRCPVAGCGFVSISPRAQCSVHGRTVVA